jgi:hypothetical protein
MPCDTDCACYDAVVRAFQGVRQAKLSATEQIRQAMCGHTLTPEQEAELEKKIDGRR